MRNKMRRKILNTKRSVPRVAHQTPKALINKKKEP